jgi:hypothetical protein
VLTEVLPLPTTDLLQGITEVFSAEQEYLRPALIQCYLQATRTFDRSETEYSWLVEYNAPIEKLEIQLVDGSWLELQKARGEHELMMGGAPRWLGQDNSALIAGLDLVEMATERRVDNWQFTYYSPELAGFQHTTHFFLHPASSGWIPIHPLHVRDDGFLNFWYEGQTRVRARRPQNVRYLTRLQVRLNDDQQATATLVQPWTSLDEIGLWFDTPRLEYEPNLNYGQMLEDLGVYNGQTTTELAAYLSLATRSASSTLFTTSASTLLASDYHDLLVQNYSQYAYVRERLTYDVDTASAWRTKYASPELGCVYVNGVKVDHTFLDPVAGLISVNQRTDNRNDLVEAHWRIKLWTDTGSGIILTNNFPLTVEQLRALFISRVRVDSTPVNNVQRTAYKKNSPSFRWRSVVDEQQPEIVRGISVFG